METMVKFTMEILLEQFPTKSVLAHDLESRFSLEMQSYVIELKSLKNFAKTCFGQYLAEDYNRAIDCICPKSPLTLEFL